MAGRIIDLQVRYLTEIAQGPETTTVDLEAMTRHCRPERVQELIDDIELLCQDVVAGRHPEDSGRPVLAVIRGRK